MKEFNKQKKFSNFLEMDTCIMKLRNFPESV